MGKDEMDFGGGWRFYCVRRRGKGRGNWGNPATPRSERPPTREGSGHLAREWSVDLKYFTTENKKFLKNKTKGGGMEITGALMNIYR